ncbi:DUF3784 domain-containing protein [Bacillus thuringiensis]|uniref:DUF3784 domain-containing protein n=3 Tax=Bacillus cereus group TaxID=86661 RepID=A0AAW4R129_BACCE|nr:MULTISPECIES: DUF3784 domain-containing protein [Bacillus cereus group]EEM55646.1 hypothetical protein bthur0007_65480 [Bacillus thuringiensis serovar monterrey BGSC 4AJ1]KAB5622107.1 DUF3784 domain-containing protein [Bacillus thuringiensis]MBY0040590.1 DUF3784 domain-containing protein [Bacillus cereus]MEB9667806.1 DUF3784 domain-containing protein [Bacillus anthracis]MEC2870244.1 DUF3784 domain-containing protein [Bacillus cereus]
MTMYIIGTLFLVIAILFYKKKALFLIAGFDKNEFSEVQINRLTKTMGDFMLNIAILIIANRLSDQFVSNTVTKNFVDKVILVEFAISLIVLTYKLFSLKKVT